MYSVELEIDRAIAELENIYPSANLISNYKDFLKYRDFLHYYQYNESVVLSLIDLAFELWNTEERISRESLIAITKRYFKKAETRVNIPSSVASKIFRLFKEIVYYENLKLSKLSVERTQKAINSIMIGVKLKEEELQWLCDHSAHSEFILNRILRYHFKTNTISSWAKFNFEKDFARNRRSEMTSWIIDVNPEFKIDKETIEYDFEYQMLEDKRIVDTYKNEMDAYRLIEKELRPILTTEADSFIDDDGYEIRLKIQEKPELVKPRRYYGGWILMNSGYGVNIPDFDHIARDFYEDFNDYYNRIMVWSIAYSRLNIGLKTNLIMEHYSDAIYPTLFHIGKRLKSVEYFKRLKQMTQYTG